MAAEIELKFAVPDPGALRQRITSLGCQLISERTFESNTLYDTPERTLRGRTELLRIRQYGEKFTLTHKRLPDVLDANPRFKTRVETESEISDAGALAEIFKRLGYCPVFRYEKYRAEWTCGDGHLVLDETPIGVYAELEGRPEWIDSMLAKLEVPVASCSTLSYGALFLQWKERTGSTAQNLTFDEVRELAPQ